MKYIFSLILLLFIVLQSANAQTAARKGKDYAVFFYVTEFDNGWQRLPKTENEMTAISSELQNNYGFNCKMVPNPTLETILKTLQSYEALTYGTNDQLLLFFSMHGSYDERVDRAYLVPKNGGYETREYRTWLSYDDLAQELGFIKCKHLYVALDACYSGAFGDRHKGQPTELAYDATLPCADNINEVLKKQSRLYATAGGKVRVPDESKFAKRFLDALVSGGKDGIVSDRDIIYQISSITGAVTPEYGTFKGDDRGSFLFVRKNACINQKPTTTPTPNNDADIADWKAAKFVNTLAFYEMYKRNHPSGLYFEEAQDAINRLKQASVPAPNNQRQDNNSNTAPRIVPPSVSRLPFEPEMVEVQGGTFQMGSNDGESDEKPVHSVSVSTFYIGKYEVTQKQWRDVMGTSPSYFKNCDDCPVEQVSWDDVQEYLKKLNSKITGKKYRLLMEAEWEYAARGGNKSNKYKYSGSNNLNELAWYETNSGNKTHPVGGKQANELGIFDMSGNVWEWCSDWLGSYSSNLAQNPTGADTGYYKVFRGGCWLHHGVNCGTSNRGNRTVSFQDKGLGFRVGYSLQ
jgi:formylglycine-generating enzyme